MTVETKKPFGLRMPEDVRDWLTRQAQDNHRSMNSEIIVALKKAMRANEPASVE